MRPGRLRYLLFAALLLALAGCGDGDETSDGPSFATDAMTEERVPDDGCEAAAGHPNRAAQEARGFVIACVSGDETSLHLQNISSHVLQVTPGHGVDTLEPAGVESGTGTQAALGITGIGWTPDETHFLLPLGGSLVASGPGPAAVNVQPDLVLTAKANAARYVAEWMESFVQARGRALAIKLQACAESAAAFVNGSAYVEDLLRNALGTVACKNTLAQAVREAEGSPAIELPRARSAILGIARPVARDRLISFAARVLAR